MNELWIYCYFEYVNDDIVLNWHKYLIYVSGLVTSTGGTENKGLYRGKKLRLKNILFFPSKSEGLTCNRF